MLKKSTKYLSFIIFSIGFISILVINNNSPKIETPWGMERLDKYSKSLSETPILVRLQDIDQSGPAHHFCGGIVPKFTRYEHSMAVWSILKKFGCSLKEQIAGLFHDSSHTVFSHVADHVFSTNGKYTKDSYQDTIHDKYLNSQNISSFITKFNIKESDLNPENPNYTGLEQPLPDMCADRIEYNIHTGVILDMISQKDAKEIINNLCFENSKWFFKDEKIAKKFADISLYCTQNFWGSLWNTRANMHLAKAINRAIEIKLITEEELFSTDSFVLSKLKKSDDKAIKIALQHCDDPLLISGSQKYKNKHFTPKFRGIDPLVRDDKTGKLIRLSEKNLIFSNAYNETKKWCERGYEVMVIDF